MASFTDPFNTGALAGGWNTLTGAASCVSNKYQGSTVPVASIYTGFTPTNDQEISVVLGTLANDIDIYGRFNTTTFNGYFANILLGGDTRIQKIVAGVPSSLNLTSGAGWTTGDTATFRLSGSTLSVLRNGTVVNTITDASYTAGFGGVGTNSTSDTIDSFTAADYSTGATASGSAVGVGVATASAILLIAGAAVGVGTGTGSAQVRASASGTGLATAAASALVQASAAASGIGSAGGSTQLNGAAAAIGETDATASAEVLASGAAVGIGNASLTPPGSAGGAATGVGNASASAELLLDAAASGVANAAARAQVDIGATGTGVGAASASVVDVASANGVGIATSVASAEVLAHGTATGIGTASATATIDHGTGDLHAYDIRVVQTAHYGLVTTSQARYALVTTVSPASLMDTIAPIDTVVTITVPDLIAGSNLTGRTDVVAFYSDDNTALAAPIDATLNVTALDTNVPGSYVAEFLGADFLNFLPDRTGRTIYRIEQMGTHVIKITPLLVVASL